MRSITHAHNPSCSPICVRNTQKMSESVQENRNPKKSSLLNFSPLKGWHLDPRIYNLQNTSKLGGVTHHEFKNQYKGQYLAIHNMAKDFISSKNHIILPSIPLLK